MSAIIDELVALIRQARYGRDVRESIAHGIEVIDDVAEGARDSATASATAAQGYAQAADQSASNAYSSEGLARSWAKGDTGMRPGEGTDNSAYYAGLAHSWSSGGVGIRPDEATNNAYYWAGQAEHYAEEAEHTVTGVISFNGRQGHVGPQNNDYQLTQLGTGGAGADLIPVTTSNGFSYKPYAGANGVASLDGNGRIPYTQLPESAMEFKGTWNASTNTPTLVSGTGDSGDFYVVSVGGTWNNITFNANDRIIFDGVTAHDWVKLVAGEVNSVNGQSGQVQLDADDIPYATNVSVEDKLTGLDSDKADTVNGISVVNGAVTVNADDIPFDNTGTDITSTDVDGAIKESYNHGGHKIVKESGAILPQKDKLRFIGFEVYNWDDIYYGIHDTVVRNPVFTGTTAEWNELSPSEKVKYQLVNLTDDGETGEVVDAVTDGDMRPVTSNAVANLIKHTNLSGTTDQFGRLLTDFNISDKIVVCVLSGENGRICNQIRLSGNTFACTVSASNPYAPLANTQVAVNVFYI